MINVYCCTLNVCVNSRQQQMLTFSNLVQLNERQRQKEMVSIRTFKCQSISSHRVWLRTCACVYARADHGVYLTSCKLRICLCPDTGIIDISAYQTVWAALSWIEPPSSRHKIELHPLPHKILFVLALRVRIRKPRPTAPQSPKQSKVWTLPPKYALRP